VLTARQGPLIEDYRDSGIPVLVWKERKRFFNPSDIPSLVYLIISKGIDLVHTNTGILQTAAFAAGLSPARSVWHIREVFPKKPNYRWRLAKFFTDYFVFNHYHTYKSLDKMLPVKRGKVIYNGVEVPLHFPAYRPHRERFKIVMVSNIQPGKGQIYLINALAELKKSHPHIEVHLIGECFPEWKWYLDSITDSVKSHGLHRQLIIHGFKKNPSEIVADCHLVAHTAIDEAASGNVILEAMALGKPVVVFWGGETPEVVKDGETGFLIPRHDKKALAEKIKYCIDNPNAAERLGRNAWEEARHRFSIENTAVELMNLYDTILNNNR